MRQRECDWRADFADDAVADPRVASQPQKRPFTGAAALQNVEHFSAPAQPPAMIHSSSRHRVSAQALVVQWMALLGLWAPVCAEANPAVVTTPQVRAELLAHAPQGLAAGQSLWLGLKIEHQPHWHTYWKNPGDSGLATTLTWALPEGVQAGDVQWPTPSKLPIGPLMNYGYEGTLLLPVKVKLPGDWRGEQLDVKLHAQWLVCKEVCIPEEGKFALSIPARAATAGHGALFDSTQARLPQLLSSALGTAAVAAGELVLEVSGWPADWRGQSLTLFPELPGVINNAGRLQAQWRDDTWTARLPLDAQRSESPSSMVFVLAREGQAAGLQVQVPVTTTWPAAAPVTVAPTPALNPRLPDAMPAAPGPSPARAPADLSRLLGALLLALAGGALLNLMPCVFPVLSLKVLGFATHSHDRGALLAGGLAYTAGVVLSFVALAALMLVLRASGEQLGWGFQLQSPLVVAGLAALVWRPRGRATPWPIRH
jgi:DsbC/DsbD-like thiol-disulfide interchange protein